MTQQGGTWRSQWMKRWKDEISKAINQLRNKPPGVCNITTELLRDTGVSTKMWLQRVISTVWEQESIPQGTKYWPESSWTELEKSLMKSYEITNVASGQEEDVAIRFLRYDSLQKTEFDRVYLHYLHWFFPGIWLCMARRNVGVIREIWRGP